MYKCDHCGIYFDEPVKTTHYEYDGGMAVGCYEEYGCPGCNEGYEEVPYDEEDEIKEMYEPYYSADDYAEDNYDRDWED